MPYDENGYFYEEEPAPPPDEIELTAHITVRRVAAPGMPVGSIIWHDPVEGPDTMANWVGRNPNWTMLIGEVAILAVAGAMEIYDNCGAVGVVDIAAAIATGNGGAAAQLASTCLMGFGLDDY